MIDTKQRNVVLAAYRLHWSASKAAVEAHVSRATAATLYRGFKADGITKSPKRLLINAMQQQQLQEAV